MCASRADWGTEGSEPRSCEPHDFPSLLSPTRWQIDGWGSKSNENKFWKLPTKCACMLSVGMLALSPGPVNQVIFPAPSLSQDGELLGGNWKKWDQQVECLNPSSSLCPLSAELSTLILWCPHWTCLGLYTYCSWRHKMIEACGKTINLSSKQAE
jgi:hypothetical protein